MKTLTVNITEFGGRKKSWIETEIEKLNKETRPYGYKIKPVIEIRELTVPLEWELGRSTKTGEAYRITNKWINENLTLEGADVYVASFNDAQWKKKHPMNQWGGYAHHFILQKPVVTLTATPRQKRTLEAGGTRLSEWAVRFFHEVMGHTAFQSLMRRPDLDSTHYWDYERGDLLGVFETLDLTHYETVVERTERLQRTVISLAKQAVELLRKLLSQDTKPITTPIQKPRSRIEEWAAAIKEFEGWAGPGERLHGVYYPIGTVSYRHNNPGNLRQWGNYPVSSLNFALFPTYEEGWNALLTQLRIAVDGRSGMYKPSDSLYEFFGKYAPSTDNNYPDRYAEFVAKRLGVDPELPISNLN